MHLTPGARIALADAGLVRFPAGLHWPLHRHVGEERMLILAGGFRDDSGKDYGPGDELVMAPGSVHALDMRPGEACISAVTLFDGLEMPPGTPVPH
jgi:anti-sigma factor ChrR (cupin superfamily)